MPIQVAVCGPRYCSEQDKENVYEIGRKLAEAGALVLNGGGSG